MNADRKTEWCAQEELAVGWAVHALEPDKEAVLRAHLPDCARCQETVRTTEEVTAAIGGSVDRFEPPAHLKARLMDAIEHTPQEQPAAPKVSAETVAEPVEPASRRRAKRSRVLLVAAAVILVAVVTGVVGQRLADLSQSVAAANARTDQLVAEANARTDQLEQALRLATDPVTNVAVLRAASGDAQAVLLSGDNNAAVMPDKLTPNDTSKTIYVVWGTSGNGPVALATFDVLPGAKDIMLTWNKGAHAHKGFAISLEPGRTAPVEPSTVVASGQVAAA